MFHFSGSFHVPVSLPNMISIYWRRYGMRRPSGVGRGGKGDPWPCACPWACTGSPILTGAHLAFAANGITLSLDFFNWARPGISHWMTLPPCASIHPTSCSAVHAGLCSIVPPHPSTQALGHAHRPTQEPQRSPQPPPTPHQPTTWL